MLLIKTADNCLEFILDALHRSLQFLFVVVVAAYFVFELVIDLFCLPVLHMSMNVYNKSSLTSNKQLLLNLVVIYYLMA